MEKQTNTPILLEKEQIVAMSFAEKKGRESFGQNPFTCYIAINSPLPNLPFLTLSLLEELASKKTEAYLWAKEWDKSVVAVAPTQEAGCVLLSSDDPKGKVFVPVSTTEVVDLTTLVSKMPEGETALIGINNKSMTIDAFLISYFHLVNELVWDLALVESYGKQVSADGYGRAVDMVLTKGFSVGLLSEEEILSVKKKEPRSSVRIYGSKVNRFVPEVMGVVIKDK